MSRRTVNVFEDVVNVEVPAQMLQEAVEGRIGLQKIDSAGARQVPAEHRGQGRGRAAT